MDIIVDFGAVKKLTLSDQVVGALFPNLPNGEAVDAAIERLRWRAFTLLVDGGMDVDQALSLYKTQMIVRD